jgi:hypothetical protein
MTKAEVIDNALKILAKLEHGGVYAIECQKDLSTNNLRAINAELKRIGEGLGVRFIVLPKELKLARRKSPKRPARKKIS